MDETSKNTSEIRIVGDLVNPNKDNAKKVVEVSRKHISEHLNEIAEEYDQEYPHEIDTAMKQFSIEAKKFILERNKRIGIDPEFIKFPESIKKSKMNADVFGGTNGLGLILIDEQKIQDSFDDKDVAQYVEGMVILEELWHSAATSTWIVDGDINNLKIEIESHGFTFRNNGAFEEGLFRLVWNKDFKSFLETKFPSGASKYKKLLEQVSNQRSIPVNGLMVTSHKDGKVNGSYTYKEEEELVQLIVDTCLDGDLSLLEKSRFEPNERLKVARKMTKVFGPNTYFNVMGISTDDTESLLNELKGLLHLPLP